MSLSVKFVLVILSASALYNSLCVKGQDTSWVGGGVFSTHDNIVHEGYVAETHRAVTRDGYILEMHRIPFSRSQAEGPRDRPVVFLMHGLLAASNCYVVLGREHSLAFNLADAGYDVWMGNARGTKNSRYHVTKDPNSTEYKLDFFDFSWEEIALIDLPTMIDYVLLNTGKEKLHYIGHSQGGTVFLVLNSMRPEYQDKIASANLLAGVGYMNHFPNPFLGPLALFTTQIWNLGLRLGYTELFPPGSLTLPIPLDADVNMNSESYEMADYCLGDISLKYLCQMYGVNEIMRNIDVGLLIGYQPGGAALKQVAHYGQNIKDKAFRRWDYGAEGNIAAYGTITPPLYDLSLITVPTLMHYTVSDSLLDERDVLAMASVMPNTSLRKVDRDTFSHVDFVFARDGKELVNDFVIEEIDKVENNLNIEAGIESVSSSSETLSLNGLLKTCLVAFVYSFKCVL